MTSPIFRRQKCQAKWERGAFALPNKLVQDKNLTDAGFRLLAWLVSCSDDWIVYQTDIMQRFDWGREKLKAAIDNLIEFKYLFKFPQRVLENGKYGPCDYEFSAQGFTDEEIEEFKIKNPMSGNPTSTESTSDNPTSKQVLIITNPNPNIVCIADANGSDKGTKKPEPIQPQEIRTITKKNYVGHDVSVGWDDFVSYGIVSKKNWDLQEMHQAWQILQDRKGYVNDPMEFLAGTISNLKDKKRAAHANKAKGKCKTTTTMNSKEEETETTREDEKKMRSSISTSNKDNSNSSEKGTWVSLLELIKERGVPEWMNLPPG